MNYFDYDSYYTLEFNGDKGWEVYWTGTSLEDAIDWFRRNCDGDGFKEQMRVTSPKPANSNV